jgi:hypothetical protein
MKRNTLSLIAIFTSVASLSQAATIIGGTTRNGDFEAGQTIWTSGFNVEVVQVNTAGGDALSGDFTAVIGTRPATFGDNEDDIGLVQNTGHTVALGETFDLSFAWVGTGNWTTTDAVVYRLFTTSDNTASGTVTVFATGSISGRAGDSAIVSSDFVTDSFTGLSTLAANIGQELWIEISANSADQSFARLDNVTLSSIPEPSGAMLGGLGMLLLLRRRR